MNLKGVVVRPAVCGYAHPNVRAMSECEISAELLDATVSNPDLATIATELLEDWGQLSPHLPLTPQQESAIRRDNVGNYDAQKRDALRRWKKTKGHAATYRALIAAATEAKNMELADSIESMLWMREKPRTGNAMPCEARGTYRPRGGAGQNYINGDMPMQALPIPHKQNFQYIRL